MLQILILSQVVQKMFLLKKCEHGTKPYTVFIYNNKKKTKKNTLITKVKEN